MTYTHLPNYPSPEPAWDYTSIYEELRENEKIREPIIEFIRDQENSSEETDKFLKSSLEDLINNLSNLKSYL